MCLTDAPCNKWEAEGEKEAGASAWCRHPVPEGRQLPAQLPCSFMKQEPRQVECALQESLLRRRSGHELLWPWAKSSIVSNRSSEGSYSRCLLLQIHPLQIQRTATAMHGLVAAD